MMFMLSIAFVSILMLDLQLKVRISLLVYVT